MREQNKEELSIIESCLYGCFRNILIGYTGDSIESSSAKYFGAAEELPGGDLTLPPEILQKLQEKIPEIKLNSPVSKIEWNESGCVVKTRNSEIFHADFCITTLPPGVINNFHEKIFEPKLPDDKVKAYDAVNPGNCIYLAHS